MDTEMAAIVITAVPLILEVIPVAILEIAHIVWIINTAKMAFLLTPLTNIRKNKPCKQSHHPKIGRAHV